MKRRWIIAVALCLPSIAGSPIAAPTVASASTPVPATSFPDGTGSITVPAGWQIASSYRGSVDVRSNAGAAVVLGLPYSIIDPNSGIAALPGSTTTAVARPGDVGTAIRQVLLKTGGQLTSLRARTAPASFPGVPAFYVLYQFNSGGKAFTAIGYLTSIVYPGTDFWQLYSSAIVAPTTIFAKTVPTMSRSTGCSEVCISLIYVEVFAVTDPVATGRRPTGAAVLVRSSGQTVLHGARIGP